jgi:hypothetical protein
MLLVVVDGFLVAVDGLLVDRDRFGFDGCDHSYFLASLFHFAFKPRWADHGVECRQDTNSYFSHFTSFKRF